jgi:hypothetical protein
VTIDLNVLNLLMEDIIVENVEGIVNHSVDSLRNTHVSQEPTKL